MIGLAALAPHLIALVPAPRPRYVGVYFLISRGKAIYVGQSIDIEVRIVAHAARLNFDRVAWIEVAADDLDAYEGAIIRALRPIRTRGAPTHRGRDNEVLAALGLPVHADEYAHAAEWVRLFGHRQGSKKSQRETRAFSKKHRALRERQRQAKRNRLLWSAVGALFARHQATVVRSETEVCVSVHDASRSRDMHAYAVNNTEVSS